MTQTVQLTKKGLERLQLQLRDEQGRLEEATSILQELTSSSDDYEDSGLEDARVEKARLEARVDDLEDQLRRAVVIPDHARTQADLGSVVTLKSGAETLSVQLVSPVEAGIAEEDIPHISDASPLGKALLGRKVGEKFGVKTSRGMTEYEVLELH